MKKILSIVLPFQQAIEKAKKAGFEIYHSITADSIEVCFMKSMTGKFRDEELTIFETGRVEQKGKGKKEPKFSF